MEPARSRAMLFNMTSCWVLAASESLTWSLAGLCCECALRSLVRAGNWRSLLLLAATRPKPLAVAAARLRAPRPRAVPMLSHKSDDHAWGVAGHRFTSMACVSEPFADAGLLELSWPEADVGAGLGGADEVATTQQDGVRRRSVVRDDDCREKCRKSADAALLAGRVDRHARCSEQGNACNGPVRAWECRP